MKKAYVTMNGKAGKSSMVNALEFPRLPGATIIRLETINDSGVSGCNKEIFLKGRELGKLETELARVEHAIVDVGASNVEAFVLALNSQFESHLAFDYFVVPVLARSAAQVEMGEAIKMLQSLSAMGIEPERIKVIFNRLPVDSSVSDECRPLINMHKKNPVFTLDLDAFVHETEAFAALGTIKTSYIDMLADQTNYRQELNKIPLEKEKERTEMVKWIRAQGTVKMLERELASTHQVLFGS